MADAAEAVPRPDLSEIASAGFLRAVLDRVAEPIFVKDASLRFVLVNPALCALVGHPPEALLGHDDYAIFPAAQADAFRAVDARVLQQGRTITVDEETLTDQGGQLHVLRTVKAPLSAEPGGAVTHIVGVITDVTRIQEAERALRGATEALEGRVRERTAALEQTQAAQVRSERLAVLGQLAAGLAHELRNPLAAIATASSILKRKLGASADDDVRQALSAMLEEVWEANRIVTELLDYARTQPPAPSRTTVARLLEDALAEVAPAPTIEVATEVEPDLLVEVDVRQTRDAIANVVRNALEAMPHGGRLTITAHGEAGDALIAVEDSGPGLTRSALAGVFEPLVTSKPLGLGLGLATARVLVENQRGSIRVATQRGAGARFEIRLPLARG